MILPDVNDVELYNELCEAYRLTIPYRTKVQFKKDLLTLPDTIIEDSIIWNQNIPGCLIDAASGFISDDLLI